MDDFRSVKKNSFSIHLILQNDYRKDKSKSANSTLIYFIRLCDEFKIVSEKYANIFLRMYQVHLLTRRQDSPCNFFLEHAPVHVTKVVKLNRQFSLFERTEKYFSKDRNVRSVNSQNKWL